MRFEEEQEQGFFDPLEEEAVPDSPEVLVLSDSSKIFEGEELKAEPLSPPISPTLLVRTDFMSNSQCIKIENTINDSGMLSFDGEKQMSLHIGNLRETSRMLQVMVNTYIDDMDLVNNLIQLIGQINDTIENSNYNSEDEHQFAFQEFIDPKLLEDEQLARELQFAFDQEILEDQIRNSSNFPAVPPVDPINDAAIIPPPPPLIPEDKEIVIAEHIPENSFDVNPIQIKEGEETVPNPISGIFTNSGAIFRTYVAEPLSSVQYMEVKISQKYKSFKGPFVLALWKDCDESKLEFSYELLACLKPFSGCILEHPLRLINSVQGTEEIQEGDTLGIGMLPQSGGEFIIFITLNGAWNGYFTYTEEGKLQKGNAISTFSILLLTGSAFKVPQVDVTINYGMEPFQFKPVFPIEDCSICYDDVLTSCITEIEGCGHRFCSGCVRGYLENAFQSGEVLETKCLDMECDVLMTDKIIRKTLSPVQYAKFLQFRSLATLRLDPDCRWCPKCEGGVVGDKEHFEFPNLTCPKCKTVFCFHCGDYSHGEISCARNERLKKKQENKEEIQRKRKEEKGTQKWMKENKTIKCSNCKALVQRNEGCNHMKCACGYEFCWLCGESVISILGSSDFPLHYSTGACAGLQFSKRDELSMSRKVVRTAIAPVRFGLSLPVRPFQMIKRRMND